VKSSYFLPPLLLGLLAGWFFCSLIADRSVTAGNVLTATVTLIVGWWIQRSFRRQAELDRVPLQTIAKLCERVDTLIAQCLDVDPTESESAHVMVQRFRLLSNEISWLGTVVGALKTATAEHRKLQKDSWRFKAHLTDGPPDLIAAGEMARQLRTASLRIQWLVCQRILDDPGDIGSLITPESTVETDDR